MFSRFFRILVLLFLPFSLLAFNFNDKQNSLKNEEIEKILQRTPRNVLEIFDYVQHICSKTEKLAAMIQSLPKEEATFDKIIRTWNQIGEAYFESIAFLYEIETVTTDPLVIEAGKVGCGRLQTSIFELLQNEKLIEKIVSYLEDAIDNPNLSSSEKYYFHAFLKECDEISNVALKERVLQLKERLDETTPFTQYLGIASPKRGAVEQFSVLNWNVCFLPGHLSMTYGGMLPWKYRLDKVVDFIKSSEADVVCLQEVFQEDAAKELYEALKDEYAYFYVNIAPKNFGFDPEGLSLGSGLFVASKYEIPNAFWAKYHDTWLENITRGFFDFEITTGKECAQIVTTHLDASLATGSAENFRALQLKQILNHLDENKRTHQRKEGPVIICGDLNILWGDNEPAEGIIKKFFYDPYNGDTAHQHTYCDYTGYWWPEYALNNGRKKFEPKHCILDYALLLKAIPSGTEFSHHHVCKTNILRANVPENPEGALSDHHALLTTYFWVSKK